MIAWPSAAEPESWVALFLIAGSVWWFGLEADSR
jgi:hypothetical protein